MKHSTLVFALVFFGMSLSLPHSIRAQAPIPNGGFEDWSGDYLAGWFVDNTGSDIPITQTSDAHSGASALYGVVIKLTNGGSEAPIAISGPSFTTWGFPYSDHPMYFTGFFKYKGYPGDHLNIYAGFKKNGGEFGSAEFKNTIATDTYTAFRMPITWQRNDAPDSAYINIAILGVDDGTTSTHVGSEMYIDDLAFANTAQAVSSITPVSFTLDQSLPNPSNNAATIGFTLESSGYTSLSIYNIAGEVIATPVKEFRNAGKYSVAINTASLPSATYWYRLCSGNKAMVRSMLIMH